MISLTELDERIKHGIPMERNIVPSYRADRIATEGMGRDEENIDPEERQRRMAVLRIPGDE